MPVCPEVELGLGTPREAIRLARPGEDGLVRLVTQPSRLDLTDGMRALSEKRVRALEGADLSGYVLKKDSPSCGMERVKVWGAKMSTKDGVGAFAEVLLARMPLLPVEEEGRLHDAPLRENWVERVFAYRRVRTLFLSRWTVGALVAFHTAEKLLVLAHEPAAYARLGKLVAGAKGASRAQLAQAYAAIYMGALAKLATRGRHVNVLQHMAGYFKKLATADERRELEESVAEYRRGLVPLVVPVTLVRHHVRRNGIAYLAGQRYLEPHPKELMLRNHP